MIKLLCTTCKAEWHTACTQFPMYCETCKGDLKEGSVDNMAGKSGKCPMGGKHPKGMPPKGMPIGKPMKGGGKKGY